MAEIIGRSLGTDYFRIGDQLTPAEREIWRRTGDVESGQREVFVQDPDGYLLMLAQNIGTRPIS